LARKKHSAKRGVRIRKGELRPSDAIRRGEIVEEIVLNLRPRKDRISETTVTAEVNRELDILLGHVPAQARWSNRARNRAHAQKLDGALRKIEKLTRRGRQRRAADSVARRQGKPSLPLTYGLRLISALHIGSHGRPQAREESCLDRSVPLGYPIVARPEIGPTVADYYARKHAGGPLGQYWPLHQTAKFQGVMRH